MVWRIGKSSRLELATKDYRNSCLGPEQSCRLHCRANTRHWTEERWLIRSLNWHCGMRSSPSQSIHNSEEFMDFRAEMHKQLSPRNILNC
jgi:hypothetical protein